MTIRHLEISLPGLALLAAVLLLATAALPAPALAADNPKPVIKYLSPAVVSAGAKAPRLYVIGTGFAQDSLIQWDGVDRATDYYSSTKLALQLTADDVAYPATIQVTVFNPAPGGGLSNAKPFMVKYKPLVKSLRPAIVELEPATLQPKSGTSYWEILGSKLTPPTANAYGRAIAVTCQDGQPVILALLSESLTLTSTTKSAVYRLTSTAQGQVGTFQRQHTITGPATGLAARSADEIYYSNGKVIVRVVAGSPPVSTSLTLPATIGGLDYVGGSEPFLLAISGASGDHRVFRVPLNPVSGDFTGTWTTFVQINVPPGSPLAAYSYTGVSLVPVWGSSREPALFVTKDDGTSEPGDIAAVVDLRGTVLQTVIADQNGILVDHTVWSGGISSSYLNWANPQGIDAAESCSSTRPGEARLFMIARDNWNKGPKYPINPPPGCIRGTKWNDLDRDGYWDPGEPVVPGWPVSLYVKYCFDWIKVGEEATQTDGVYQFCDLYGSGDYRVVEGEKPGWTRSWPPNPGFHEFFYTKYTTVTGKDFGNFQASPGTIVIRKEVADSCLPPPSGMAGWWTGDATSTDTADGNDGTLVGAGFAAGKVGGAFSLDGTGDHVQIPETHSSLDGFGQLTLDAWVKPETLHPGDPMGLQTIVAKYDYTQTNGVSYWLGLLPDGKVRFAVYSGNAAGGSYHGVNVDTVDAVTTGVFTHVAGVWDGVNTPLVYVNGVLVDTTTLPGGLPMGAQVTPNTVPVTIGAVSGFATAGQPAFFFDGVIDEVEIFGRALSGPEVNAIAGAGSAGKCRPGQVSFPFTATGGLGIFSLVPGGEQTFGNLAAGNYAVTEVVPDGWTLQAIHCSDSSGGTTTSGSTAQIGLVAETVTCTFVNTRC